MTVKFNPGGRDRWRPTRVFLLVYPILYCKSVSISIPQMKILGELFRFYALPAKNGPGPALPARR